MAKSYFECHITMEAPASDKEGLRKVVETLGWKFSAIEGDIVLGDGVRFYATRHYNSRMKVLAVIDILVDTAATLKMYTKVVRRKVELVLFDDRSSAVRPCDGGCIECHLDDLKD